jgi:hypothetical protein
MDENERAPRSVMDAGVFFLLPISFYSILIIICVKLLV